LRKGKIDRQKFRVFANLYHNYLAILNLDVYSENYIQKLLREKFTQNS